MKTSPIVLNQIGVLNPRSSLVHEAAHLWHSELDESIPFSATWLNNFPKPRNEGQDWKDPDLVVANGVATAYGNFDYNLDVSSNLFKPSSDKIYFLERDELKLECFGDIDVPIEVLHATLIRDRNCLTSEMAEVVSHVKYFPAGNGSYVSVNGNENYRAAAEDIATMTEFLYAASLFPKKMADWIARLHCERILRRKSEALVTCGFVRQEALEYLLDPVTLRDAAIYDYSPAALSAEVSPPFIGYVPRSLSDSEIRGINFQDIIITSLHPEVVCQINHPAGVFYSIQRYDNNGFTEKLLHFVLSRSDLGVVHAFSAIPHSSAQHERTLWISGPRINNATRAVEVNKKIMYKFSLAGT